MEFTVRATLDCERKKLLGFIPQLQGSFFKKQKQKNRKA